MKKKLKVTYTVQMKMKGHEGLVVKNIEYPYFKNLVLLNELRTLYFKDFPEIVIPLEQENKINKEDIQYLIWAGNVFKKQLKVNNAELLKSEFPKHYDFICHYIPNKIIKENVEELYRDIIYQMNLNIKKLVYIQKILDKWDNDKPVEIETDILPEFHDFESKNILVENQNETSKSKKSKEKLDEKTKIPKFIWNKTWKQLELLFNELIDEGFISEFDLKTLNQHFKASNGSYKSKPQGDFTKINWKSEISELPFSLEYLIDTEAITKEGSGIHKLTDKHFTIKGDNINIRSITSLASNVRSMKNKPRNYIELQNLIDRYIK